MVIHVEPVAPRVCMELSYGDRATLGSYPLFDLVTVDSRWRNENQMEPLRGLVKFLAD